MGNFPIPEKLLKQGVRDMVRLSDARMSGTAFGTIVLHISPESAIGGPLALVQDGDEIELDVPNRRLHLQVDEAELTRRRAAWQAPAASFQRGYGQLYLQHVTQAPLGCDFDFLQGNDPVEAWNSRSFSLIPNYQPQRGSHVSNSDKFFFTPYGYSLSSILSHQVSPPEHTDNREDPLHRPLSHTARPGGGEGYVYSATDPCTNSHEAYRTYVYPQ